MNVRAAGGACFPDPVDILRSNWANGRRLLALLVVCFCLLCAASLRILWGAEGMNDSMGRLLGGDFIAFWAAGKAYMAGEPVQAYNLDWFAKFTQHLVGEHAPRLAFNNPPTFYFLAIPLSLMPFLPALIVWLAASYAAFALVIRRQLHNAPSVALIAMALAAYPGIYGNGLQGQTGFLLAAVFGVALLTLDSRPVLSGLLFALLAWKPQFGLLVPIALIAGRRWTVIFSAAGFGIAMGLASLAVSGIASWTAFLQEMSEMRELLLNKGVIGYHLMQSLFGALRLYHVPLAIAYPVQIAFSAAIAILVWRVWAGQADARLKHAALLTGSLLISPYFLDYDLVMTAPAIALLVSYGLDKGFGPWEQTGLALAFICPPLARFATFFLGLPLGLMCVGLLFTFSLLKAQAQPEGL